ncbi:MAG: methionyl-tRNA formyltransferase [Chitinophagaceae bacterium]
MKSLNDLRIVFFGTPDFALASLVAVLAAKLNVVAVVTAPDKPSGRGLKIHETPVKLRALQHNIPVLQPEKLKSPAFIEKLKSYNADIQVVVAFRMLPEVVWNMPPLGTINVHASLLPQYRGAAPINWVIINGETETGVTTFRLQHAIDTGNILLQDQEPILPTDNAGTLHDKLMHRGAALLLKTLEGIAANNITPQPQSAATELRHAPKIFKPDTEINWQYSGQQIQDFIRGLSPHPAAFSHLKEKQVKIYATQLGEAHSGEVPGSFNTDGKTYLRLAAKDVWVNVEELQQEGKKRMQVGEFLRGFRA